MNDFGIAFSIFGFDIRWYSILILVGVLLAFLIVNSETKRFGIKKEFMFNLMFWTIIIAIIGARIYYVLFNLDYYLSNPSEIIKIWNGGLAIHGAIIGGSLTMIIYCQKYKAPLSRVMDMVVPALLLGQAIGRWGNFFNQEAYGSIVAYQNLLDMKIIPQFVIDNMYINGSYHLPMFYFESLWCLLGVIVLFIIRRIKYIKCGSVTSVYLIWYGLGRFVIEAYRTDSLMFGNIKIAQVISVLFVLIGVVVILIQSRKPKLDDLYNTNEIEEIKY